MPVDVMNAYDAIAKVFAGRAKFLDVETCATYDFESWVTNWDEAIRTAKVAADRVIVAPTFKFMLPEIIVCSEYRGFGYRTTHRQPKFSRGNIYRRDRNTCFAAGTMVLMDDGRQIPIESIRVGDRVVDAHGKSRPVVAIGNRWSEDVVSVRYRGSQICTTVTKDHPFLSSTGEYKPIGEWMVVDGRQRGDGDYLVCPRTVEYETTTNDTLDVSKFFAGEWFRFRDGRIFWSKRKHEPGFPAFISVSPDWAYLLGLYCAEGSVSNRNITWSLHENEQTTMATDIQKILASLGLNSALDKKEGHGITVRTSSKVLAGIVTSACGSGAHHKHTPWKLIGIYRKEFLRGLLMGDGYIAENFNKVVFNVASFQLVMDVQAIALGMGVHATIQAGERPDGRKYWSAVFQGQNYIRLMREVLGRSLEYAQRDYPERQFGNDEFVFRKLTEVKEAEPCVVYNIEVADSHSYIANGVAVHNCQFCGKKLPTDKLTIDHIIPKSKGGKMVWENVVLACMPCNAKKDDQTPEEAGMSLIKKPKAPIWIPLLSMSLGMEETPTSWRDYLYLNHELTS